MVTFVTRLDDRRLNPADRPPWSLDEIAGELSDRIGRRKVFVAVAAVIYAAALPIIATANDLNGYFLGLAISGLGFGRYMAVDLNLVVDILPNTGSSAKDLGVLNVAGALPFALAPAVAPAILALGHGSYTLLYEFAGGCALVGAAAIGQSRASRAGGPYGDTSQRPAPSRQSVSASRTSPWAATAVSPSRRRRRAGGGALRSSSCR